jgi:hypothetical protein
MQTEDIQLLEKIVARHKYRYEILDSCFSETVLNTVIYIPINVTLVLTEIEQFKETLVETKDFNLHAGIAIANLFAHYKHYYSTKQVASTFIIGFVKDSFYYKKFHSIIRIVENICEFFPHVFFMGNYASIKHTILVAGLLQHIHTHTATKLESSIHIYSSFNVDKQLLCIFPSKEAYKICKPMNGSRVEFLSRRQFIKKIFKDNNDAYEPVHIYKSEIERLCVILGIFFGTYECYSSSEKKSYTFSFSRGTLKYKVNQFLSFLTAHYNNDDPQLNINQQLTLYLKNYLEKPIDLESLKNYVNRYDYFTHQGPYLHNIIRELYNAYRVKILDYEMSKESEKYRLFIQHPLYANWLMV